MRLSTHAAKALRAGVTIAANDYVRSTGLHQVGIDETTRGVITSSDLALSVHEGEVFFYTDFTTIGNGVDLDFTVTTSASIDTLFIFEVTTSLAAELTFFENTTIGVGGATRILEDLNRRTANTAATILREDPTITTVGNRLLAVSFGFTGQGNTNVGSSGGGAMPLARSQDYLARISSLSAGNIVDISITVQERATRG